MIKEDLLEIKEGESLASPSAFATTIEPFRSIIRRDRGSEGDAQGRKKLFAAKELAYIYGMSDYRSPYSSMSEDIRAEELKNRLFDDDWEPDELIREGIEKYKEMYDTELIMLLKSARRAIHNMSDFYNTLDLSEKDDNGKLIHNPNTVMTSMGKIGNLAKQIDELEDMIRKQHQETGKIRGNVQINEFNQ